MARFDGSWTAKEVLNLNDRAFTELVDNKHRELQGKFGPGVMNTARQDDGTVTFTYDYAEKFGSAPEGSHLNRDQSRVLSADQAEAVKRASSYLRNKASVKQVDDPGAPGGKKYVPVEDGDEGATQLCADINVLDQMVALNEGGYGQRDSSSPVHAKPPTQVSGAGLSDNLDGGTANDQAHQRDEAMGTAVATEDNTDGIHDGKDQRDDAADLVAKGEAEPAKQDK